jgi:EpsI family protein
MAEYSTKQGRLSQIILWMVLGATFLSAYSPVVNMLDLDDYLFRSFKKGEQTVTLYVGYYRRADKVGAAHDPLVCFHGQGWGIVDQSSDHYTLAGEPSLTLSFSSIIAERQGEKEQIVYWFQTNGRSSPNTLSQKIDMVKDRLFGHGEDNAFIRITSPIGNGSPDETRKRIFDFIDAFYPAFRGYIAKN